MATKSGNVNKRLDYTVEGLVVLLRGERLKPLHIGRPMNALYVIAKDILTAIGVQVGEVGDADGWIDMASDDFYYVCEPQSFGIIDLLVACNIGYDKAWIGSRDR